MKVLFFACLLHHGGIRRHYSRLMQLDFVPCVGVEMYFANSGEKRRDDFVATIEIVGWDERDARFEVTLADSPIGAEDGPDVQAYMAVHGFSQDGPPA